METDTTGRSPNKPPWEGGGGGGGGAAGTTDQQKAIYLAGNLTFGFKQELEV